MPEAFLSMASLNVAVDIKPADIAPAREDPVRAAPVEGDRGESFDSVLAQVRHRSQKTPDAGCARERSERTSESPSPKEIEGSEPETQSTDDLSAQSPAGGAAEAPNEPTGEANPSQDGSVTPLDTANTEPTVRAFLASELSLTFGTAARDFLVGLPVMSDAEIPSDSIKGLPIDPALLVDDEMEFLLPAERAGDERASHAPILPEIDLASLRPSVSNDSDSGRGDEILRTRRQASDPQPVRTTAPRSEWTNILEFNRLLNPRIEREPSMPNRSFEPMRTDAGPPRQDVRANPEPSRNPEMSRFDFRPVGDKTTGAEDLSRTKLWMPEMKPDAAYDRAAFRDFAPLIRTAFLPAADKAVHITPAGGVEQSGPIGRSPVQTMQSTGTDLKIDPRALVSDVREAVLRIAADGRGEARITLHPPELGELVVRLESARNGVVRAEFHTLSPLVREALEAGLSKLTDALKAEGLTLAQADVHLNLQLGAEGNAGEPGENPTPGDPTIGAHQEASASNAVDESTPVVERLPEGATISVLA